MITKKNKTLLICKDAGAANILKNYIEKKKIRCDFFLRSPAIKIFKKNKLNFIKSITDISNYNLIISGTSIDKFELKFIKKAKKLGIKSMVFLDHWSNYKSRFTLHKKLRLPDKLITFDKFSFDLAKKTFAHEENSGHVSIKNIPNQYLSKINNNKKKKNDMVIFSSNYDKIKKLYLSDEKIIYLFIKKNLQFFKQKKINSYFIKLHPSESKSKFSKLLKKIKNELSINSISINYNLDKIISKVKYAAGYNSMALVKAKLNDCITIEINVPKIKCDIPKKYINLNFNIT